MVNKLKEKLNFELLNFEFVTRDGLLFLDIEIDAPTLKEIEEKSKIISRLLDDIYITTNNNYYLNIFSSGIEKIIKIENLKNYIDTNIKILLINPQLNKNSFEGKLLTNEENIIKLQTNIKGCIRKLEFVKNNILQINESIKIKKVIKEKNEKSN